MRQRRLVEPRDPALGLEAARQLCAMSDVLEVLDFLARQRPQQGQELKNALQDDINAPEFWEIL